MVPFLVIIVQSLFLFLLGNMVKRRLFLLSYKLTQNKHATVSIVSFLMYPGVVLHELAHLVVAVLLFVPVKSITLVPKMLEDRIRGGAVVIAKVDPIRSTLVGIAPLFVGISTLWATVVYILPPLAIVCEGIPTSHSEQREESISYGSFTFVQDDISTSIVCTESLLPIPTTISFVIALFLIFSISLTMYSSRKDLTALLVTLPLALVLGVIAYIVGVPGSWIASGIETFSDWFYQAVVVLLLPIVMQALLLGLLVIVGRR